MGNGKARPNKPVWPRKLIPPKRGDGYFEYPVDAECDVVDEYPVSFLAQAPKLSAATASAMIAKYFII
jgi:hypothetical protein